MDTGTLIEIFLWTVVAVLGGFIYFRIKKIGPLKPTVMEIPPQPKPEVVLRDFTPAELKEHTGASPDKPVLLAVKGKVYDVSAGRGFYGPGGGYHVFAGHECARALAVMSTSAADVGSASLEGLGQDEIDTLNQWIAKFDSKYPVVGSLSSAKN